MGRQRQRDGEPAVARRLPSSLTQHLPKPAERPVTRDVHPIAKLHGHEPERSPFARDTPSEVTVPERIGRERDPDVTEPEVRPAAPEREEAREPENAGRLTGMERVLAERVATDVPPAALERKAAPERERPGELRPEEARAVKRAGRLAGEERAVVERLAADFVHPRAGSEKILQYWRNWSEDNPKPALLKRSDRRAHADYENMFAAAFKRREALESALTRNRFSDFLEEREKYGPTQEGSGGRSKSDFQKGLAGYYGTAHERLLKEVPSVRDWSESCARSVERDPSLSTQAQLAAHLVKLDERVKDGSDAGRRAYVEAAVVASVLQSRST